MLTRTGTFVSKLVWGWELNGVRVPWRIRRKQAGFAKSFIFNILDFHIATVDPNPRLITNPAG